MSKINSNLLFIKCFEVKYKALCFFFTLQLNYVTNFNKLIDAFDYIDNRFGFGAQCNRTCYSRDQSPDTKGQLCSFMFSLYRMWVFRTNKSALHKHLGCVGIDLVVFSSVYCLCCNLKCTVLQRLERERKGMFHSGWWPQILILAQAQSVPAKTNSSFLLLVRCFRELCPLSLPSFRTRRTLWTVSAQQTQTTVFGVKEVKKKKEKKEVFSAFFHLSTMQNISTLLKYLISFYFVIFSRLFSTWMYCQFWGPAVKTQPASAITFLSTVLHTMSV